jgi:hypothetical protein
LISTAYRRANLFQKTRGAECAPQPRKKATMTDWSADQLKAIAENDDLFVSPFREDGVTYGTPTQTWALVVGGKVYVRAANGQKSSWYQAAVARKTGRVRVADQYYDVVFEPAGDDNADAIDAAYEAKYPGSAAVPIMQGAGPKSASVRISPADRASN